MTKKEIKKENTKNKPTKKVEIPKTKKKKLKIKHIKLIAIACVLLVLLLVILLISKKEETKENKVETPKKEVEKLDVFNIESDARPYAVMIPNDAQAKKRQYGIQDAYITYEITVEGGITRLLALYKDKDVDKIGPVRSSRHYFLDYALENDAIYVHFGWSPQAESDISSLKINNLNGLYNPSNMFNRDTNYDAPNNAYTSTEKIKKAATDKEYRMTSEDYQLFDYKKNVDLSKDSTSVDASKVKIEYAGSTINYEYDETNKYYLRYNGTNKHIDNLTKEQVHTKNILVLKISTVNISGDDKGRQNLNNIGTGEGYYITNGKMINITWTKDKRNSKTIIKNSEGKEIKLSDGNTFIQIQPTNKKVEVE